MRILHTESSCGWGGQELRILSEAQGLSARGHSVTVAAPGESRILPAARERGLDAVTLPIARKNLNGLLGMMRLLRQRAFDVINTHSSTDSWLAALACAMRRDAPPIVRTRHISAPVPLNRATRWLYVRATRHIVTTGEHLRTQLIERNGFPPERITSVPTGIDLSRFVPGSRAGARRALQLPEDATLIGIVATLRSWKGHHYLLEAMAGMQRERCLLVIVGDGPQRQKLEAQVSALQIGDRVRMVGNQHDVLPWLQALDLFALPSYANEGVPQALIQAMLCGLPCVTTGVGSIAEAAVAEQNALVVPPRDSESLRRSLQRLADSPDLQRNLGTAAREWCRSRFGLDTMLDRMERVFRHAAGQA